MPRIGIISDTHGLLRPEVENCLAGVAHIIHAGDIGAADVIDRLRQIAPVTAIRGNVDIGDWASIYPETQAVRIGRCCFYILHDVTELKDRPAPNEADAVIYGHSHKATIKTVDGILYLNPGSAGPRRFKLPVTLATLDLDAGGPLQPVVHDLCGPVQARRR